MPNWNMNSLSVNGKGKNVKKFIKDNFKTHNIDDTFKYLIDFDQYHPTPIDEKTGDIIENWYSWRIDHWGCKWTASKEQVTSLSVTENDSTIIFYDHGDKNIFNEINVNNISDDATVELISCFDTPWCPPDMLFINWAKKYKDDDIEVKLSYYEPGMAFAGNLRFKNDEYSDYGIEFHSGNTKEYVMFILNEGWETTDWCYEWCEQLLYDMHSEEILSKLLPKINEMIVNGSYEEIATLVADIQHKWYEYTEKGEKNDKPSEK